MKTEFRKALQKLINQHSIENGSNTPDFILAEFLSDVLEAWDRSVTARAKWYGVVPEKHPSLEHPKPFPQDSLNNPDPRGVIPECAPQCFDPTAPPLAEAPPAPPFKHFGTVSPQPTWPVTKPEPGPETNPLDPPPNPDNF